MSRQPTRIELGGMEFRPRVDIVAGETIGWVVPQAIWLNTDDDGNECLMYNTSPDNLRPVDTTQKVLDGFIRLRAADDQAILDFARQYGTLGICCHQALDEGFIYAESGYRWMAGRAWCGPSGNTCNFCEGIWRDLVSSAGWSYWEPMSDFIQGNAPLLPLKKALDQVREGHAVPQGVSIPRVGEPLDAWRSYAGQLAAISGVVADLHRDASPNAADTQLLELPQDESAILDLEFGGAKRESARHVLFREVVDRANTWVTLHAPLTGRLAWNSELQRTEYMLRGRGLSGQLSSELMGTLTSQINVFRCGLCNQPFTKPKSPGKKQPSLSGTRRYYCSDECRLRAYNHQRGRKYDRDHPQQKRQSARRKEINPETPV